MAKERAAAQQLGSLQSQVDGLQRRAESAESALRDAQIKQREAERASAAKEAEVLKLIQARDALSAGMSPARGGDGNHEDQLAEMEDEMYSLKQQLEEEQDRASELEAELSKLKASGGGGGVGSELQALQLEVSERRGGDRPELEH